MVWGVEKDMVRFRGAGAGTDIGSRVRPGIEDVNETSENSGH